jgi:LmbE family N-acetylglucosaminyl deacetylase
MPDRIAILSPHLDDAVLSAWSALRGAGDALVVNVCTALPAAGVLSLWDRLTGAADSRSRMTERLAEDRAALALAGCDATALGFPEQQYRDGPLDADALADAIAAAVRGTVQVWAPAAIGGHEDHVQVRDAALRHARDGGPPLRLYADLPYATRFGWPGWVAGGADDPHLIVEEWWARFLPSALRTRGSAHGLPAGETRRKLDAIGAYRTQATALDGGPLGVLRHPRVISHEVSWAVTGL